MEKHKFISASDKDYEPIFEKLCQLATIKIFEFTRDFAGVAINYSQDDLSKLAAAHEDIREQVFLEEVYGHEAKLDNEEWLKKVVKTAKWVLNSKTLREKVFEQAKVKYSKA